MLYLAILQTLDRFTLGMDSQQLKRACCVTRKSPVFDSKIQANKWLETVKQAYPEKYYIVRNCVISFEENEKENVESMLSNLIKMFN